MTDIRYTRQTGSVNALLLSTIILALVAIGAIGAAVWGIKNYTEQKTDVDTKIQAAVATAKKDQADSDLAKYQSQLKDPNTLFAGPSDYGRLTFMYPKNWSVYVYHDVVNAGDTYQAYFNPGSVPAVNGGTTQIYALQVTIQTVDFDTVLGTYNASVKAGTLQSSTVTINGSPATRLDGKITSMMTGSIVVFKIRDKTVTIQTDSPSFTSDFNALVSTIKFNS